MQKSQLTIRLQNIIRIQLEKMKDEGGFKSVNDLIVDIIEREILKKESESKVLTELTDIKDGINAIGDVLKYLMDKSEQV
jgi:predicted CopG family antitoxin